MSKVIFKLRQCNPNKKGVSGFHVNHINYIAKRSGVEKHNHGEHGLFGKVDGFDRNIIDFHSLKRLIKKKSDEKTILYRGVISLSEEDAIRLGFNKIDKWQDYLEYKMNIVYEELSIKPQNAQWVSAFHNEKSHPHVHFVLWDKNQGVKDYFVHVSKTNNIRKKLIKDIFQDDFQNLFNEKELSKQGIKEESKNILDEINEDLLSMTQEELNKYSDKLASLFSSMGKEKIHYSKFEDGFLDELSESLFDFYKKLPAKGRLNYGFLTPELKSVANKISNNLINNNKELSAYVHRYVKANTDLAKTYGVGEETLEKIKEKAFDDSMKIIGNKILNCCKEIKKNEKELLTKEYAKRQLSKTFLLDLLGHFSKETDHQEAIVRSFKSGELSTVAKKEYAIKMLHAGLDWER